MLRQWCFRERSYGSIDSVSEAICSTVCYILTHPAKKVNVFFAKIQRHSILWKTVQISNPFQITNLLKSASLRVISIIRDSDNLTIEYLCAKIHLFGLLFLCFCGILDFTIGPLH